MEVSLRETDVMRRLREETYLAVVAGFGVGAGAEPVLALLMKLVDAKRAIEVGIYTGYTTLAMAHALPEDGRLLACDVSDEYTSLARRYWQEAGMAREDRPAPGACAGDADGVSRRPGAAWRV